MNTYRIANLVRLGAVAMLAVTLSACGKNEGDTQSPKTEETTDPMEARIRAETMGAEPAITCLTGIERNLIVERLYKSELRDKPRGNIPRDKLILWDAHEDLFMALCVQESTDRVYASLTKSPYIVVNETAKRWFLKETIYTPTPKGEFEKTDDYNKRIAAEKSAYEAAAQGRTFGAQDVEIAWGAAFGPPKIYSGISKDDPNHYRYDVDREVLSFNIKSHAALIPVSVSISPAAMKSIFDATSDGSGQPDLSKISLEVVMQYDDGKVTIKSIGFYSENELQKVLDALPFDVKAMPVNQEIPFHFGR